MVDWKKLKEESEEIPEDFETEEKPEINGNLDGEPNNSSQEEQKKEDTENTYNKIKSIKVENLGLDSLLKHYEGKIESLMDEVEKRNQENEKKENELKEERRQLEEDKKELESEKEKRKKFENLSKKEKQKKVHYELRGLLRDYPLQLDFEDDINNFSGLVKNLITVDNLMNYAKYHTTKEEIRKVIDHKQKEIDRIVDMNKLRSLWYEYKEGNGIKSRAKKKEIMNMISPKINELVDIVEYFSLVIPRKEKKSMNLRSAHGFPASNAEEYEEAETEEGKSIGEDTQFKVDPYEGTITPV